MAARESVIEILARQRAAHGGGVLAEQLGQVAGQLRLHLVARDEHDVAVGQGLLGRAGLHAELEQERVYDCIECGCCSFTCPAGIPLLDVIRISKAEVMKIMRSRPKK